MRCCPCRYWRCRLSRCRSWPGSRCRYSRGSLEATECRAQYQVQCRGFQMRIWLQPDVREECAEGLCGRHLGCAAVLDNSVAIALVGWHCLPHPTTWKPRVDRFVAVAAPRTTCAGPVKYLDRDRGRRNGLDLDLRGLWQLSIVRDRTEKRISLTAAAIGSSSRSHRWATGMSRSTARSRCRSSMAR